MGGKVKAFAYGALAVLLAVAVLAIICLRRGLLSYHAGGVDGVGGDADRARDDHRAAVGSADSAVRDNHSAGSNLVHALSLAQDLAGYNRRARAIVDKIKERGLVGGGGIGDMSP